MELENYENNSDFLPCNLNVFRRENKSLCCRIIIDFDLPFSIVDPAKKSGFDTCVDGHFLYDFLFFAIKFDKIETKSTIDSNSEFSATLLEMSDFDTMINCSKCISSLLNSEQKLDYYMSEFFNSEDSKYYKDS
jgi:hypothetical protein